MTYLDVDFAIWINFTFISNLQAKALTTQTGETDKIRFLVGTQSLRVENQVYKCKGTVWDEICSVIWDALLTICSHTELYHFSYQRPALIWYNVEEK